MTAGVEIDIQIASRAAGLPDTEILHAWVAAALSGAAPATAADLTVRIVDEAESRDLNKRFRDRDAATNVLSFPAASLPPDAGGGAPATRGDIVICAPLVLREAETQGKQAADHWAHLLVHGVLHLLGYDHETDADARAMESLEVRILAGGGVDDPYAA